MSKKDSIPEDDLKNLIDQSANDSFDKAPCGYLFCRPGGGILKINQTLLKWLGYTEQELVRKKKLRDLISTGGKIFYETHYAPLLLMQGFVNEINFTFLRKDGSTLPVLVNSTQHRDDNNNPLFNSLVIINYSDRKKYEMELLAAKKKAVASDEAKSLFLSTISHEILTPLNAIVGSSDLLLNTNLTEEQLKLCRLQSFSAKSLMVLINDILAVSKAELGQYGLNEQNFNIVELCQNLILSFQYKIKEKKIHLGILLDEDLPHNLIGDPFKIGQVITNLLSNAIKFTSRGSVELKVELTGSDELMAELKFTITDTGIGIEKSKLANIFEAFTQADKKTHIQYGGSGLGLSICKHILDQYNSKMHVESEPGKGSIFSFTLKLSLGQTQTDQKQISGELPPLENIKVLLAEDNSTNLFLASRYFDMWKLDFDIAANGSEAVKKVLENDYDLVLMDLKMPVMDGYEATMKIRKMEHPKKRNIPVIAFSASASSRISQKMLDCQINGFILKPFDAELLHHTIMKYSNTINLRSISNISLPFDTPPSLETVDENHPIDLSKLHETFEGDREGMMEFLNILLEDLTSIKSDINTAIDQKDFTSYRQATHKLNTIMHILSATYLNSLLQAGKKALIDNYTPNLNKVQEDIANEINRYLDAIAVLLQSG